MRARDVITRKRFREWLDKKFANGPRTIVGRVRWASICCPMATFVQENGCPLAQVGEQVWWPGSNTIGPYQLTRWAKNFISAVSNSGLKQITAQRAIALLESA